MRIVSLLTLWMIFTLHGPFARSYRTGIDSATADAGTFQAQDGGSGQPPPP